MTLNTLQWISLSDHHIDEVTSAFGVMTSDKTLVLFRGRIQFLNLVDSEQSLEIRTTVGQRLLRGEGRSRVVVAMTLAVRFLPAARLLHM